MAGHERLIHVKIASKSASVIISNPNGNSRFNQKNKPEIKRGRADVNHLPAISLKLQKTD
jgi:hypothetical protein